MWLFTLTTSISSPPKKNTYYSSFPVLPAIPSSIQLVSIDTKRCPRSGFFRSFKSHLP